MSPKPKRSTKFIIARLKQIYFQKTNPKAPWLVKQSIELLEQLIGPEDVGLEFGSGRSTHWLATRCKFLYSIEHHQAWYETVKTNTKELKNLDYRFTAVSLESGTGDYLNILQEFSDKSIEFVLNDGKARLEVAEIGIQKLKSGGLMIIDNAERYLPNDFRIPDSIGRTKVDPRWEAFERNVRSWRRLWHTDGVCSTLILFKP